VPPILPNNPPPNVNTEFAVALTVYYMPDRANFRVGVSLPQNSTFKNLLVRWFAIQA